MSSKDLIRLAQDEMKQLFPWLSWKDTEWSTVLLDKAEPRNSTGILPKSCYSKGIKNMIVAWPTKLALAPKLSSNILEILQQQSVIPERTSNLSMLSFLPEPSISLLPWEKNE